MAPFVAERMLHGNAASTANECLSCGLLWCGASPSGDDLSRYYEDYWGRSYVAHRMMHEPDVVVRHWHLLYPRGYVKEVERFVGFVPSRVLDIGGGRGVETPFRGVAEVHVLDVAHGDPADGVSYVSAPDGNYELVVLSHVLEHVPDPVSLLVDAALSCSGVLYVEVPDEASGYGPRPRLDAVQRVRREWHEHLNYFDACSLTVLAGTCGLEVLALEEASGEIGSHLRMLARPR